MKDKRLNAFFRQQKGTITVEFALMLILLCLLIVFMTDVFIARSTIGKLDRTSYSLLNVIKERANSGISDSKGNIPDLPNSDELERLTLLANRLLFDDPNDKRAIVILEALEFKLPENKQRSLKVAKSLSLISSTGQNGARGCKPQTSLQTEAASIVPLSEMGRFVPIIRVTVCIPKIPSMFLALSNALSPSNGSAKARENYHSSSIGVIRASSFSN
ncbi:tight adherence pilus pseudopilin TadF [Avibacterium paragallinarum]|uniref:tight adherence pilus pseudopilin TadF n=1 Tax=Avibacterium paragallinarum TaxID=728 RepID=UPI00397B9B85